MAYTCGCGMKALKELEAYLDSKGVGYFVKDTADHWWPYRRPRIVKDDLRYVVIVWAGKSGIRPEWRFLAIKKQEGIDNLEEEIKDFRAYPYIRKVQ